jgi:hypothetical protein
MKNLHLVKTDKPSRLFLNKINNKLLLDSDTYSDLKKILPSSKYQHIYITSDEEIKEGDWCILLENHYINGGIGKYNTKKAQGYGLHNTKFFQKIILTTDQPLIDDGVQAIDEEFLQWFVKNPSCEEVEVKSFCKHEDNCPSQGAYDKQYLCDVAYKIIIPQEDKSESMTKEEQGKFAFDRFIAGAKSDTARDYWYSKFKQETTLEQIDQTNHITKGSIALVYKQDALKLDELESKLDNSLSKETTESLFEWLISKRVDDDLTDDEWLIKEKHKETLEFGEWLLANEIDYVDNTNEGNIYIIFGYMDYYGVRLTMEDLHKIYLKH